MKQLVLFILLACSTIANSQVYQKEYLFQDNFSNNQSPFDWSITNNSTYSANIVNGKYLCYLPHNNDMDWNWTWVNIPSDLTSIFNKSQDINLDLDFKFEDNYNYANFGLMFDLHNVTDDCPGGSFYELYFTRENNSVQTAFRKNDNCELGEEEYLKEGVSVNLQNTNHLTIQKSGLRWNIFVNSKLVLELNFKGSISLNKLRYSRGRYSFDNITAYSKTVILPPTTHPSNNLSLNPRIWALCVGVEDYSGYPGYNKSINDLNYCVDDAQAYYSFLSSVNGGNVPSSQLILLSNHSATNSNILLRANELFSKATDNDLIIVFLSGHGGSGYFCASNDALRYEEINKILERSRAKRKLLIADACHSGTWAQQRDVFSPRGKKLTDTEALQLFYSELSKSSENITYLLAARPEQISWETNGHGVFTNFLIRGLSCAAKLNDNPIITIENIYKYLEIKVYEATKYKRHENKPAPQNPVLEGKYDRNMPVSICNN